MLEWLQSALTPLSIIFSSFALLVSWKQLQIQRLARSDSRLSERLPVFESMLNATRFHADTADAWIATLHSLEESNTLAQMFCNSNIATKLDEMILNIRDIIGLIRLQNNPKRESEAYEVRIRQIEIWFSQQRQFVLTEFKHIIQ